jgi:hypothetical protein
MAALAALFSTPPTTIAGIRAVLKYVVELDRECEPEYGDEIAPTLLRSRVLAD